MCFVPTPPKPPAPITVPPPAPTPATTKDQVAPSTPAASSRGSQGISALRRDLGIPVGGGKFDTSGLTI